MGARTGAYMASVWKTEGKEQLTRPRRRWEDDIKKFKRYGKVYTRVILFRIGISGGLLWTQ
jgi:hypothetical protein